MINTNRRKNYLGFLHLKSMIVNTEEVVTHYPAPPHFPIVNRGTEE